MARHNNVFIKSVKPLHESERHREHNADFMLDFVGNVANYLLNFFKPAFVDNAIHDVVVVVRVFHHVAKPRKRGNAFVCCREVPILGFAQAKPRL